MYDNIYNGRNCNRVFRLVSAVVGYRIYIGYMQFYYEYNYIYNVSYTRNKNNTT